MSSYVKNPDEVESYLIDFTSRLLPGESIDAVTVVAPEGIDTAPGGKAATFTDRTVTTWIGGGTAGSRVNIVARVTTSGGRVKEQSIRLRIIALHN